MSLGSLRAAVRIIASGAAMYVITVTSAAHGQDAPEGSFGDAYDAARELVEAQRWKPARKAIEAALADFEGDPEARLRLGEIEEDLQLCLFNETSPAPSGKDLFGPQTKRFSRTTRQITMEFPNGPAGPLWTSGGSGLRVLEIRFDGTLSVSFYGNLVNTDQMLLSAIFCYDPEKKGGYVFCPGLGSGRQYQPVQATIQVMSGSSVKLLKSGPGGPGTSGTVEMARKGTKLSLKVGSGKALKVSDYKFTSGFFALRASSARELVVKGRVDKAHYRQALAEFQGEAMTNWRRTEYDRKAVLPAWILEQPETVEHVTQVPSDCPNRLHDEAVDAIEKIRAAGPLAKLLVEELGRRLPPRTQLYLRALAESQSGDTASAVKLLSELIERQPEFAPGYVARARARFGTRNWALLEEDLAKAEELDPDDPELHALRAIVALFQGDLDAAYERIGTASAKGLSGPTLELVQGWVLRARRGPRWSKRFVHETKHFVIASDHGKKLCVEVGKQLESSRRKYDQIFGSPPSDKRKSRVYVFAGREGYLRYAGALGMRLEFSAGAYSPNLRELVMWAQVDSNDLLDTARHEGFHQFLDGFLGVVPPWFNEGYAEHLGGAPWLKKLRGRSASVRDLSVSDVLPLDLFLRLDQSAFMEDPALHYAQAEALVGFLHTTKDKRFADLLSRYFDSLRFGLSQEECFDAVFGGGVLKELEPAFKDYVRTR